MKKISIITLGCKVNQVESELLAEQLENHGYVVEMGLSVADIFVLNTCAVTNEAERKSRNMISKLLKLNDAAKIYVCGCSSQNNSQKFKDLKNVKFVCGTSDKFQIINQILDDDKPDAQLGCGGEFHRISKRTRATLWVQNGCNNFCTYCLIPYLRGREVSFPLSEIESELKRLEKLAKEIVITGINLSAYGTDIPGSDGLIEVARLFNGSSSRFRFSSLEVGVIDEKFLKELATMPNFCDQFHLSLQSGCDKTLHDMNRHYDTDTYLEKVNLIRKYFPNAGITTDLIVGFPTETEQDFEDTLKFIRKVGFSSMHIFPYSRRSGTVAAKMKSVATNVALRASRAAEVAKAMKQEFIQKNLGQTFEVIVENKKGEYYLAHTKNFILCYIDSKDRLEPNTTLSVTLLEAYSDGAIAKIAENKN